MLFSPLAYYAGVKTMLLNDPNVGLGVSIDREKALALATAFANAKGVDVTGWPAFIRPGTDNNLFFYYKSHSGSDADFARSLAPAVPVGVLLRSPDRRENIEVLFGIDGHPLGYQRHISRTIEFTDPGEMESRKIAEAAIKSRLRSHGMDQAVELKPGEVTGRDDRVRRYYWRWPLANSNELQLQSVVTVRGNQLVGDLIEAKVNEDYAKKYLHYNRSIRLTGTLAYGVVLLIAVFFGVYRFVKRARQKEVSYSRVILLTLLFAAVSSSFVLITDVALYEVSSQPDFPAPDWIILFSSSMFYLLIGLFLGLAYGSGEGDIREAYPGKLTSLDALLTGRIFSKNVARSVITGWAFGGWLLLCNGSLLLSWRYNPTIGKELSPLDAWFGKVPWLAPFIGWPMDVILIIVIGLLIPLPLFHRRFKKFKYTLPPLAVFMWMAASAPYYSFRPWLVLLGVAAIRSFFALVAFFQFDLLTTIVALASPTFISFVVAMTSQPSSSMRSSGAISLFIALLVLAVEFFFAFRGRFVREDEVRPIYAKHLAERLSMQAEVSAAREAQKRLMPEFLPQSPEFSIAASCIPAYEVGGDFYDLFTIEPGKIGVLVAEGGGKGLGSALSIAFAKGFLMPKITGNKNSDDSPGEVIRSLQDRLQERLKGEAELGIAYAVIDATDGSLRYARTTTHPSILIAQSGATNRLTSPEEKVLSFESKFGGDNEVRVIEGIAYLNKGDSIIFFTDGIAKDWAVNGTSPEAEFARVLSNAAKLSLQESLTKAMQECAKDTRRRGSEDDLTAVVVRFEPEEGFEDKERTR